jgi:cytochrome P450
MADWHGLDPSQPGRLDDPFPLLRRLREVDPVNLTPIGTWRLSRYRDVVRLLREVKCGVRYRDGRPRRPGADGEAAGPGTFMLEQDPPNHTRLRRLVSRAFTPRAAEGWRPRARVLVKEMLDRVERRGEMDVIADLALPLPSTLICEMLGVPAADRERFTVWTADATHNLAGEMAPPEVRERAQGAAMSLAGYFNQLIEERRQSLSGDLLSTLIRAEEEGDKLSTVELLVQSIGLLIAGFETTIGLIGNGVRHLIRHPDQLEKLRSNPGLIASAVEECLRYDGPVPATVRILHEDAEFGGKRIPADSQVICMLAAANRDPERFPDPERFDVERRDNEHLAFGGGTHMCLGAHLARMETQEAIGALVQRFAGLELESDTVEWGRSLFRVPGRLPVRFRAA